MLPRIIERKEIYVTGLSGDASKTGAVWSNFDNQYNNAPFSRVNENGYEIRFSDKNKAVNDVHVGFLTESEQRLDGFTTTTLPATEYAVFDVYVAKGYDSGNVEIEKWLEDNSTQIKSREIGGNGYIVEFYGERFMGGNKPDSIVELWVPFYRI